MKHTIRHLQQAASKTQRLIQEVNESIRQRDRLIVELVRQGHSMQTLADEAGLTRGRVSQIVARDWPEEVDA